MTRSGRPSLNRKCGLEGCERKHYGHGFCQAHNRRWKRDGDPGDPVIVLKRRGSCIVSECTRPAVSSGLCDSHRARWKYSGEWPTTPLRQLTRKKLVGPCLRDGCDKESRGTGFCQKHYSRLRLLQNQYGFDSWAEFDAFWDKCGGVCGVCDKPLPKEGPEAAHIDHCHRTGNVRGLLCRAHNTGLGMFDDDPELLKRALRYLQHQI